MKLVSYLKDEQDQLAMLVDGFLYNMDEIHPNLPGNIGMFLNYWDDFFPLAQAAEQAIKDRKFLQNRGVAFNGVSLLSPVPYPGSLRHGFGFQQHLQNLKNIGAPASEPVDKYPSIAFGNHHGIKGAGVIECMPDHLSKLDYELQAAAVICKPGRNIASETAEHYIGGLMIMNSFSARAFQLAQPGADAKVKDFATVLGPVIVTLDELEPFAIPPKEGHIGKSWNLAMTAAVNGSILSSGNLGDADWTFSEMIERASYGVNLYPGDIISSGTVASGCLLELKGIENNQWLKVGDTVELEIEQLGKLVNTIEAEDSAWRIVK